jgi:hypothetical protein
LVHAGRCAQGAEQANQERLVGKARIGSRIVAIISKMVAAAILLSILALVLGFFDSFRFNPDPSGEATFKARAQQKSVSGITVSISALGAAESRRSFGEDLAKQNIQPFWLSIENETESPLALLSIALDPDYYSPYEVSYKFHGAISFAANRARDRFFLNHEMANVLPPHAETTGFLYSVLDNGIKYAHVVLAGDHRVETFDFALPIPGPHFVGTNIHHEEAFPGRNIEDLDLASFKATFSKLACCTTGASGDRDGDPLNLVIVEGRRDPIIPFIGMASRPTARRSKLAGDCAGLRLPGRVSDVAGQPTLCVWPQARPRAAKGAVHNKREGSRAVLADALLV